MADLWRHIHFFKMAAASYTAFDDDVVKWWFVDCIPQWYTFPSQKSLNGVRDDAYRTPESCKSHCVTVPSCVGVDFDFNDMSCRLHSKPGSLKEANTYWQRNTTQYRLIGTCMTGLSLSTCAVMFLLRAGHVLAFVIQPKLRLRQ